MAEDDQSQGEQQNARERTFTFQTADDEACKICRGLDGVELDENQIMLRFPNAEELDADTYSVNLHDNCRCILEGEAVVDVEPQEESQRLTKFAFWQDDKSGVPSSDASKAFSSRASNQPFIYAANDPVLEQNKQTYVPGQGWVAPEKEEETRDDQADEDSSLKEDMFGEDASIPSPRRLLRAFRSPVGALHFGLHEGLEAAGLSAPVVGALLVALTPVIEQMVSRLVELSIAQHNAEIEKGRNEEFRNATRAMSPG